MMDKDKLRKADIFSGSIIMLFGLWIISQALQMPMKGSYGGVQNVWYVSPALLPLFVGSMIALLGGLLIRIALKTVGLRGLTDTLHWLGSSELLHFFKTPALFRFYAMIVLFFSFVFLNIPRIDFFLCAILFLIVFITMFYFDDDALLKKMLLFYLTGTIVLLVFFSQGLSETLETSLPYPGDWLNPRLYYRLLHLCLVLDPQRPPLAGKISHRSDSGGGGPVYDRADLQIFSPGAHAQGRPGRGGAGCHLVLGFLA